ncbi:hypothetical protein HNP37_003819 [Flavobacterium nitrogenifigens]|uniref:Uncharacterized protein n=3 Tax=Flavobacteriaceae TaxID=49546 RepID=A0A7W7J016_9FLAO|nr:MULTISPECIES: hypothetical protein [Flavobacterium]MBB4803744.1 hypothetical protein [Flavobacterium nitrogenifigens]MBB6388451.1 hypothetical protein [Flavobacterium notoginsengisoli]
MMKIKFLLTAILCSVVGFAQSVNDYKAVIVPLKYDFIKTENQYRLATLSKSNLVKAGFVGFYANEQLPEGYTDRCQVLYMDVVRDNAFLVTKLFVQFKDCFGQVVYTSEVGKSKEKDFELAYKECLDNAFKSIYALHYKYSGNAPVISAKGAAAPVAAKVSPAAAAVTTAAVTTQVVAATPSPDLKDPNLLYAQPTESGYQLIDKTPKVVMKLLKTSQTNVYIAIKDNVQGSLILKEDGQWYFESYQNDKLVSEKIVVKF